MTDGQCYGYSKQCYRYMYNQVYIKLTAYLILILSSDSQSYEPIGCSNHYRIDDADKTYDTSNDRKQSIISYSKSLQTESGIYQATNRDDG